MDFVCKLYGNTYAVHVTVALVGVATLNLALPAPDHRNLATGPKSNTVTWTKCVVVWRSRCTWFDFSFIVTLQHNVSLLHY